jgi:hypothetical protein
MLTLVTAQNSQSGTLQLPLQDSSDGYSVKDIQGLGPVKATLTSSQLAQMDGGQLHNARREPRNILMKIGLEPDYVSTTVPSLRAALYEFFMPKSRVTLGFSFDDVLTGVTDCVVESADTNMFTADPGFDISLISYDPDFLAPDPVVVNGNTTSGTGTTTIPYPGTSDAGIIFSVTLTAASTAIKLYNTRPDLKTQIIDILGTFLAGDQIVINTCPKSKGITIIRSGLNISALFYLQLGSEWISLMNGDNKFRAYYTGTSLPYTVQYTARYGGF